MHLYERIYEDQKLSIEEGEVRPGERLPSIRELAARYGCNKLTVQKSFELLEEAGLAENLVGSGSFVTYPRPPEERGRRTSRPPASPKTSSPTRRPAASSPLFWPRSAGKVFSASAGRGEASLLASLSRRFCLPAEGLTVLGGGQQGLDLCRRLFGSSGRAGQGRLAFLVEEPSYPAVISLFKPDASIPLEPDGPDPDAFAAFFSGRRDAATRVFYAMPDLHNPTGFRYSEEKKRAIAALARDLDVYIIEDDYLSELEAFRSGSRTPRFVDLLPERTLWIKSLSKTTAPGIRIGVLSSPPSPATPSRGDQGRGRSRARDLAPAFPPPASSTRSSSTSTCPIASRSPRAAASSWPLSSPASPGSPTAMRGRGFNLWLKSERPLDLPSPPWAPGRGFGLGASLKSYLRLSFMAMGEAEWPRRPLPP